jgi:hypothetical protein
MSDLFLRLRDMYRKEGGAFPDPILGPHWPDKLTDAPSPEGIAREITDMAALASLPTPVGPRTMLSYGTPPFDRQNWRPDASWPDILTIICNRLTAKPLTALTRAALERFARF